MNIHELFIKIDALASMCPGWKREEFEAHPGQTHIRLDLNFSISGGSTWRGEKGHIKAMLKPVDSGRSSEVVTDSGIRKVTYDLELDEPIQISEGGHGLRTVAEAMTKLFLYRQVTEIAASMQTIIEGGRITHEWYEIPEYDWEHNQLDIWAYDNNPATVLANEGKSTIQEACKRYDLPYSGNKDELRERLLNYAIENGKPGEYEKWRRHTYDNEFATLAEAREAL